MSRKRHPYNLGKRMVVCQVLFVCSNTIPLLQNAAVDRCVLNKRFRVVHFRGASNSVFTKSNGPNVLKSLDNVLIGGCTIRQNVNAFPSTSSEHKRFILFTIGVKEFQILMD